MRISDWSSDVCSSDLDVLASDYVPVSMLAAALRLAELGVGISLPEAMKMTSLHPARAAGLEDRGEIAPGKRADLIRVRLVDGQPVVRTVYAAEIGSASCRERVCQYV